LKQRPESALRRFIRRKYGWRLLPGDVAFHTTRFPSQYDAKPVMRRYLYD
jgi:hypothetical protein